MEKNIDLSVSSLFFQADFGVQLVMLILLGMSIWSWAIILERYFLLKRIERLSKSFEKIFWSGESLEALYKRFHKRTKDPLSTTFCAGILEWEKSHDCDHDQLIKRLNDVMSITIQKEGHKLERRIGSLATVGSIAPFIGLFGTVWGIVNSFRAIGAQKSTSLAIVAPHISEALFATALGLLAAIPAVMAYNYLSSSIHRMMQKSEIFMNEFLMLLSRQIAKK